MVPGQPEKLAAVRREARRGEEVVPLRQDASGLRARAVEVHGDNRINRLAFAAVILAHADPALARLVDHAVSEAPGIRARRLRREGAWSVVAIGLAIKPPVGKAREIDRAVRDQPRTAAVFMYARARVEGLWRDVAVLAICARPHDDISPLLLRAALEPVDIFPVEADVRQRDRLGDDQVGRDRRLPGTVGCDLLLHGFNLSRLTETGIMVACSISPSPSTMGRRRT